MSVAIEFAPEVSGRRHPGPTRPVGRRHLRLVGEDERPPSPGVRPAVQVRSTPLRLTLLGRRVLALTVLGVLLLAAYHLVIPAVVGALDAQAGRFTGPTAEVVVLPGDTLWSIAASARPEADPRDTVIQIRQLNGLADSQVSAGQRLTVPSSGG